MCSAHAIDSNESVAFLPCPFCGSTDIEVYKKGAVVPGVYEVYAVCRECEARGPRKIVEKRPTLSDDDCAYIAIAAWNGSILALKS